MNKKSSTLYKQIVEYKPTASESEREDQRQKDIIALNERINKLTAEGNNLIKGVTAGMMLEGDFRGADRVREIQREIRMLNHELKALSQVPIFDDAFCVLVEELDNITAQRQEAEKRYSEALQEREKSMHVVPFDIYKGIEQECYDLSAEVQKLRKQEAELTEKRNHYERKTDALFAKYCEVKDAETKKLVAEHIKAITDYLTEAKEERDAAEKITFGRKGKRVPELYMVAFGGDLYRQMLHYCEELIAVCKE